MERGPDHMPESLSFEEAVSLTSEPLAIFDAEANLRMANPAFHSAARQLEAFLRPGMPWSVFLSEAVRQGILTEKDAAALRVSEERLLDRPEAQPEAHARLSNGNAARARLKKTSDDGFVLAFEPETEAPNEAESELEVIMSKVLEACPTCLTMSRIGDGRILYRSPAAKDLLGKGFNSLEHFADRAERGDFLAELLPSARIDDMRITACSTDGRRFPASISARLIDYRGEDVIVASIDDLTERLEAEAEIERQEKQLFQLEKLSALGEVLSGIAHELNNPLSVVVGNAHLLLEEDMPAGLRPRIEKMTEAAERCVRIVRAFLSMARDRPLELEQRKPDDIIDAAVSAFETSDHAGKVSLSCERADHLPAISVDEIQMVQVLVNILTNASQAIASSGIGGTIRITAEETVSGIRIRISDDGPGIPAAVADRVFDPLFTTKDVGEGTGLGLALCHRIVVAHGGSLTLEQGVAGAAFVIELPTN
ncbi:MAG: PAS-domain containing protein [Silicimonas sp.]|nr:PAS-domain containing protein [Silicimonas sp.]